MTNPNQLISIIIPVFNESESIGYLLDEVLNVMCSNKLNFEIVVVNDGSQDSTSNVLDELTIKIKELSVISLRTNYGQTAAMAAGFDNSNGEVVITLDGDLQNDPRGGNLLNFNVGEAYFAFMPRLFWVELQTRFGNQYYVKDHGEDGAVLDAINSVKICLDRGGCQVVPGLPKEQYIWTLCTSILGGLVAGFAAAPRKEGQIISIGFLALLSPLWGMLFGIFGLAPIISRTSEVLPLFKNGLTFAAAAIAGYLLSQTVFSRYEKPKKS